MKKLLLLIFVSVLVIVDSGEIFSQAQFDTGNLGIIVNDYGRVRPYTPGTSGTRQIDRLSILVGTASDQVFDYQNDVDTEEPATSVVSPTLSDFEITVACNNAYSNAAPNVLQRQNVYGWTNGPFVLVKNVITNREVSSINAIFGLDIVTQLMGSYGMDTIEYVASDDVIDMHKGDMHVGLKFLSQSLASLYSFEWYDAYYVDTDYYTWLTHGTIDPVYDGGSEGPVVIPALSAVPIGAGDSTEFWFAIAIGSTQGAMLENMLQAESKYVQVTPVELTSFSVSVDKNNVMLKWETATEINNRGFEIERKYGNETNWVAVGFKEGHGTSTDAHSYSYTDDVSNISASHFSYRLKQVDFDGTFSYSNEVEVNVNAVPSNYSLSQNYPNPLNPSTIISFSLPYKNFVTLKVYNLLGEEVASLISKEMEAGNYSFNFQSENLPSGIYLYTLSAGKFKDTKKMILLK